MRGKVSVLDPRGLEKAACACYVILKGRARKRAGRPSVNDKEGAPRGRK